MIKNERSLALKNSNSINAMNKRSTMTEKRNSSKIKITTFGIFAIAAILITGFSLPGNSYALISSAVGSVTDVSGTGPFDVRNGQTESDLTSIAFNEQQLVNLTTAVDVDHNGSVGGPFDATNGTSAAIPAGTYVNSHYIHFDPATNSQIPINTLGNVTFAGNIIGVITNVKTPTDTSLGLAGAGTQYGNNTNRQLESSGQVIDTFSILDGGKTIEINFNATVRTDAIRVLTEPVRLNTTAWGNGTDFTPQKKSWAMFAELDDDCNGQIIPLFAKQTINVGNATLTCNAGDGNDVSVLLTLNGGTELVGSHVHTEEDADDFPQAKSGNPKPGKFEVNGGPFDNPILVDGDEGFIAIHLGVEIFEQLLP